MKQNASVTYDQQTQRELGVAPFKRMTQNDTDIKYKDFEMKLLDLTGYQRKHEFLSYEYDYESDQLPLQENKVKNLTVVIVGGNADLRKFLNDFLSLHYNCFEASNEKDGYKLIARIIPDIVISDVLIPIMDSNRLCERIKGNSKTCHIPIILLTSQNAPEDIITGFEKGADACVTKPLKMTVLKAQISQLIKNRELIKEKYLIHNLMVNISSSNLTRDEELITRIHQLLEENMSDSDFSVHELASGLNMSQTTLYRKVKALTGLSPIEFTQLFKMQRACELLSTADSVRVVGISLGFTSMSYFSRCFKRQYGVKPTVFR